MKPRVVIATMIVIITMNIVGLFVLFVREMANNELRAEIARTMLSHDMIDIEKANSYISANGLGDKLVGGVDSIGNPRDDYYSFATNMLGFRADMNGHIVFVIYAIANATVLMIILSNVRPKLCSSATS